MYTLNETIKLLTDVADGHDQIAARGVGNLAEWNPSERTYPLLWIVPLDTSTEDGRLGRTFRIGCLDRVLMGEEGQDNEHHEQEVLSDMECVLLDFVAYFVQQDQEEFFTTRIANLEPVTETLDDRLAGYFVELTILHDWTFDKCQIPATIGSPASSVDGITLYDFCDDSVFNRLTDDQKTCLTTQLCGTCDDATVQNHDSSPTWSQTIASGGSYTLPQAKMLDSDGTTTVLADYIPNTQGFMFTATACGGASIPATINGGADVGYGEALTIGCDESYSSYNWIFCSQDYPDIHKAATGQNPSGVILNWNGVWDVQLIVEDGSGGVGYATTTVTVNNGLQYHNLMQIANSGGGYTGSSKLITNDEHFRWNGTNNFVLLANGQLSGDGGFVFKAGCYGTRAFLFTSVQDDPTTKNEHQSTNCLWNAYNMQTGAYLIKDNTSFLSISSTGGQESKYYKLSRVSGTWTLSKADSPAATSWTLVHTYSQTSSADLYGNVYLSAGSLSSDSELFMFGSWS